MVSKTSTLANSYKPPKETNHPHYDVTKPNEKHQFDLLYVPHNIFEGNTYKYILTCIDVASRYKVASTLKTKTASEVFAGSNILKGWCF